jgi:hypothetical protein
MNALDPYERLLSNCCRFTHYTDIGLNAKPLLAFPLQAFIGLRARLTRASSNAASGW